MSSIPVLGVIYSLSFHDDGPFGTCCSKELKITLQRGLMGNLDHLWRVTCHEIGHAYLNESGLSDYMNRREQEMGAQTLGNFIYALFPQPHWFEEFVENEAAEEAKRATTEA